MRLYSVQLPFNEAKVTQAAAKLLSLSDGEMNYTKLIKLLYLIDRQALLKWGRPVSTDCYVSMNKGPVLSNTLNLINDEREPGSTSVWAEYISKPSNYRVSLLKAAPTDELSQAEEELIEEVFNEFRAHNQWQLIDFVHTLPEWQDPHGSAIPIDYKDILVAGNKTPIEIQTIEEDLQNIATVKWLLPRQQ
jgi:uncharacterized phage-associated protein